jgi:hypothetical protein
MLGNNLMQTSNHKALSIVKKISGSQFPDSRLNQPKPN